MILRAVADELRGLPCLGSERRAPLTFFEPCSGSSGCGLRGGDDGREVHSACGSGVPRRFPAVARRRFYWPSPPGRPLNADPRVWADSKASARGDRLRGRCPKISFWALRSPAARFFAPGQRGTARGSDQERVLTRRVGLPVQSISLMQGGCVRKPVLSAVLTHNPTFFMRCMGGRSANERPQDV